VATAFHASDLGGGPTSTVGLTPAGAPDLAVQPGSNASAAMLRTKALAILVTAVFRPSAVDCGR
jgi:hypothetical protein